MAHKKGVGSSDNGRDSNSKRLGVKLFGGQHAIPGNIIVRQRGTKYHAGLNVGIGKDHTLYALTEGNVTFSKGRKDRTFVHILMEQKSAAVASKKASSKAPETMPKTAKAPSVAPKKESISEGAKDNLTKIEGIGPKVNGYLNQAGILTFSALAASSFEMLTKILSEAGPRYKSMNPTTWPQQAQLAADEKWDELKKLQDKLDGGRIVDEQE